MSEHLQHNELTIPAEAGWHQMRMLLDEHIPVKPRAGFSRKFSFYFAATITGMVLLSISLKLDQSILQQSGATLLSNMQIASSSKPADAFTSDPILNVGNNGDQVSLYKTNKINNTSIAITNNNYPTLNDATQAGKIPTARVDNKQRLPIDFTDKIILANTRNKVAISFPKTILQFPSITGGSNKKANRWSLFVGLGSNYNINASQNYQPYPTAELLYHLTPDLFIAAGLDMYAPMVSNAKGINQKIYVNDLVNNIHYYNQVTTYSGLHYINVPVTAGVKLAKNVFLQSGVQASILAGKHINRFSESYDYQERLNAAVTQPPIALTAMPQQEYALTHQSVDYKLLAGLHYKTGKIIVGLTYQHGMRPLLTGDKVNSKPARSVALKILLKIK